MLTGRIIKNPNNLGYTGFFAEFLKAITDGSTEEEVKDNIFEALQIIFEIRKMESASRQIGVKKKF